MQTGPKADRTDISFDRESGYCRLYILQQNCFSVQMKTSLLSQKVLKEISTTAMSENVDQKELDEEAESLLYTLAKIFAQRGDAKEVAILADGQALIKQTDYDNWDGGTYSFSLFLKLSPGLYAQVEAERQDLEEKLAKVAYDLFRIEASNARLAYVRIGPRAGGTDPAWREKATAWAAGKGLTNQGRVKSANIASKSEDGLLFRSNPEILLYKALKTEGVSFAPLPVFIRGGETYQRMEPDFIVIKNGITLQVEVDGDTVHTESPAEAQTRVAMLEEEGVHVQRFASSACDTPEKARVCAKKILERIANRKQLK